MQGNRKIKLVLTGQLTLEGAGGHLNRVFGHNDVPALDPFLLLDDFLKRVLEIPAANRQAAK